MFVQIILDKPNSTFTNLDIVSGKVQLRVTNNSTVSNVVVKLEGESRTRLLPPSPVEHDRQRPLLEIHKLLYKTQVVWPPSELQTEPGQKGRFTLNIGQYEYPFQFKIPFNNSCSSTNVQTPNLSWTGLQLEVARPPPLHVKQTLPPSISGFPGEAEIRYFLKVTVNRPQLLKENTRIFQHFTFLPIEPPRSERSDGEAYARRQHQFQEGTASTRKPSLIGKLTNDSSLGESTSSKERPRFSVDARLPNPAILTCNDDIPLRILLKQLNTRKSNVYLQMLHIELIAYTKVRAHEVERVESTVWMVVSMSNMAIPLGSPNDPVDTETDINREYWSGRPLPKTVSPSFNTCNISRYYELEVRIGLGYGSYEHGKDQLIVLPLRLPVKVFSGIAPPPALLQKMETGAPVKTPRKSSTTQIPLSVGGSGSQTPITPMTPSIGQAQAHAGSYLPAQSAPGYEDAPPSYEDAVAQDIPPVDGPRQNYEPPPHPDDSSDPNGRKT